MNLSYWVLIIQEIFNLQLWAPPFFFLWDPTLHTFDKRCAKHKSSTLCPTKNCLFGCRAQVWIRLTRCSKNIFNIQSWAPPKNIVFFFGRAQIWIITFNTICKDYTSSSTLGPTKEYNFLWDLTQQIWQDLQRPYFIFKFGPAIKIKFVVDFKFEYGAPSKIVSFFWCRAQVEYFWSDVQSIFLIFSFVSHQKS